uniref:Uncharacterized protein n=1 Tax=Arundo donax TaxID=35708 RepID=A0A0A9F6Y7_ARUDO
MALLTNPVNDSRVHSDVRCAPMLRHLCEDFVHVLEQPVPTQITNQGIEGHDVRWAIHPNHLFHEVLHIPPPLGHAQALQHRVVANHIRLAPEGRQLPQQLHRLVHGPLLADSADDEVAVAGVQRAALGVQCLEDPDGAPARGLEDDVVRGRWARTPCGSSRRAPRARRRSGHARRGP